MNAQHRRLPGKVWLVGAGPGDPDLLTLKAVQAIAVADVILVDDLVSPAVLAHAAAHARVVHVGKRGGCPSTSQSFIERLMVKEALAGRTVVRLKGGDPFVFGRGGEEREALMAQGLDVEVVPGVTAGIAAPARLGIAVTHRAVTHGVALVTAHGKDHDEPDWRALVASGLTLVVYMGVARAARVVAGLRTAGMRGTMPVAVIQDATRDDERSVVTTLDDLVEAIAHAGIGSPAIIVIGSVVTQARAATELRALVH